jgi:hypothetical protein
MNARATSEVGAKPSEAKKRLPWITSSARTVAAGTG